MLSPQMRRVIKNIVATCAMFLFALILMVFDTAIFIAAQRWAGWGLFVYVTLVTVHTKNIFDNLFRTAILIMLVVIQGIFASHISLIPPPLYLLFIPVARALKTVLFIQQNMIAHIITVACILIHLVTVEHSIVLTQCYTQWIFGTICSVSAGWILFLLTQKICYLLNKT